MSITKDIEQLFEQFDAEADPIIDMVVATADRQERERASVLLANGLAMRLVEWCLGSTVSERDEAESVATSLVTELHTLRKTMLFNKSAESP